MKFAGFEDVAEFEAHRRRAKRRAWVIVGIGLVIMLVLTYTWLVAVSFPHPF